MVVGTQNYELLDKYAYIENTSEVGNSENTLKKQCSRFLGRKGMMIQAKKAQRNVL